MLPQKYIDFLKQVDLAKCRFSRPKRSLLLCGGNVGDGANPPTSVRDYILRKIANRDNFLGCRVILAEDINRFFPDSGYTNLISFERNIAHAVDVILLVVESPGSIAELGAFSQVPEIANKLVVFVSTEGHPKQSFISLGPIRYLQEKSRERVAAFDWSADDGNTVDLDRLRICHTDMLRTIEVAVSNNPMSIEYNSGVEEVLFVLIASICFSLRAATIGEIQEALKQIGHEIQLSTLRKYLFCLKFCGWIQERQYGTQEFLVPRFQTNPVKFQYRQTAVQKDTTRWQSDIVSELKAESQSHRLRFFADATGGAA